MCVLIIARGWTTVLLYDMDTGSITFQGVTSEYSLPHVSLQRAHSRFLLRAKKEHAILHARNIFVRHVISATFILDSPRTIGCAL
jgi:hypothetical protein